VALKSYQHNHNYAKSRVTLLLCCVTKNLTFNFFFHSLYPDTSRLTRFIKPLAEQMSSQQELQDLKDLVARKPKAFEKSTQGVKQALEVVELNNQWKSNNYFSFATSLNRMIYPDIVDEEESLNDDVTTTESILI